MERPSAVAAVLVALTAAATLALVGFRPDSPALALAPVAGAAVIIVLCKAPLRASLVVLLFFAVTLEHEDDASGLWRSPLYPAGLFLHSNLNKTLPLEALHFSGLDLLLGVLLLVLFYRKATGSRIDGQGRAAGPLRLFAGIWLLALFALWAYGMSRGGDFRNSLWQCRALGWMPLLLLLLQSGLRGQADRAALGRALVAAACIKACVAVWVRLTVVPPMPGALPFATSHEDSILFACVFAVVVARLLAQPETKNLWLGLLVLPVLGAGMIANGRRLALVETAVALLAIHVLSPSTRFKRALNRLALMALPLAALYLASGWTSQAPLYRPVQILREMLVVEANASARWRDMENANLLLNIRDHPLFGTGFGHEYAEKLKLPDISRVFPQYRYMPHNGVLGLWAYCGVFGFTALWSLLVAGIFLAARACHRGTAEERTAALSAVAGVLVYAIQGYGDIGLQSWTGLFTVAPALAVADQLAVATGAWPTRRKAAPLGPGSPPPPSE